MKPHSPVFMLKSIAANIEKTLNRLCYFLFESATGRLGARLRSAVGAFLRSWYKL